jgi:hypothetical protein
MPDLPFSLQMAAVIAGALGGTLIGIAGGVGGDLARRGESRRWIDVVFWLVVVLGGIVALLGVVAGALQLSSDWLWMVGVGVVLSVLAWRASSHVKTLRAEAPSSRIIVPGEPNKSR